jgi:hypothetical protein
MLEASAPISSLYRVAWLDPAGGKRKHKSEQSRAAILCIGQDELERVFIFTAWAKYATTTEMIEEVLRNQERWHPKVFGMDASGTQFTFAETILTNAKDKHIALPLRPQALTGDKLFHIEHTLEPVARSGRLFKIPGVDSDELRGEWESFPNGTLDLLDGLACAISLLPKRVRAEDKRSQVRRLEMYLRATGATQAYIDKRRHEVYGAKERTLDLGD